MANQTFGKLFVKVATLDKSARVLARLVALSKQASVNRKQLVQTKVANIVASVVGK